MEPKYHLLSEEWNPAETATVKFSILCRLGPRKLWPPLLAAAGSKGALSVSLYASLKLPTNRNNLANSQSDYDVASPY